MASRSAGLIDLEVSGGHRRSNPLSSARSLLTLLVFVLFPLCCSSFTLESSSFVSEQKVQRRTTLTSLIAVRQNGVDDDNSQRE